MNRSYRIKTIRLSAICPWLLICLAFPAAEPTRSERLGAQLFDVSVQLGKPARKGDAIELLVTYSNKTSFGLNLAGAFQTGGTRSGIMVTICDKTGKIVSESQSGHGSLSGARLEPYSKVSGNVLLPGEATPNVTGEYTLMLKYQKGAYVEGKGYEKEIEADAKPLVFSVDSARAKFESYFQDHFDEWKKLVTISEGETRTALLADAKRDLDSRRFLVRVITDASFSSATKLQAIQMLKYQEFPYEKSLVDLLDADNGDIAVKIAVVEILPWMKSQGGISPDVILRRIWDSMARDQNLRYRLAVLNSFSNSAGLTPAELRAIADKQNDPNVKFLAMLLLLSKVDIQGAKTIATKLCEDHSPIDRSALGPYAEIGDEQIIANLAVKYMKLIKVLETEARK